LTEREPPILIANREQLIYTLAEAAEIEHNLMCCYLYAAWSLKTEPDDGVDPEIRKALLGWERAIVGVAIDEMTHLALVANLLNAVCGGAHFSRPNFPIGEGYHPAEMSVRLAPFNRATLQHFIHLERPEDNDEPDGEGFVRGGNYRRGLNGLRFMPSAQDYRTVGHLYRSVEAALRELSASLGEAELFCGEPALQVGHAIVALDGLEAVTDLASACRAIETIVEQGEGAQADKASGHYQRFIAIRSAYDERLRNDPSFAPAFPAAVNPVMRRPPSPEGRVWICDPAAQATLDVGNAAYAHMLRFLAQGFAATDPARKRRMFDAAIDLMTAVSPLAKQLARMPANATEEVNAGLSFSTLRSGYASGSVERAIPSLRQRTGELARAAAALGGPRGAAAAAALSRVEASLGGDIARNAAVAPAAAQSATVAAEVTSGPSAPEIVDGRDLTLVFDGNRCIHARFCVTGAPKTFLANVKGPWLHPDATPTDLLVEIAHACPSGAVAYRRKDSKPDESAPPVNLIRIRENGPYAVHAALEIAGEAARTRATLCRCGASKQKPYCDGSHHDVPFLASGETETISLDSLAARDGTLAVTPLRNGPLGVAGNLEICSGTGRVVKRVTDAKLCRCGHSNTKPFCDGTHRKVGFAAPGA